MRLCKHLLIFPEGQGPCSWNKDIIYYTDVFIIPPENVNSYFHSWKLLGPNVISSKHWPKLGRNNTYLLKFRYFFVQISEVFIIFCFG